VKTTVGLFMGGVSVEHEISVISAIQAFHAINKDKYDVLPIYITKEGIMYTGEKLTDTENFADMQALIDSCERVLLSREKDGVHVVSASKGMFKKGFDARIDVAFPVVHGTNCEDGTLAGVFESLSLPYVGCDILSSALGMDKYIMKKVLEANGLPVVPHIAFTAREFVEKRNILATEVEKKLGFPVIVKPANLGSSVGIKRADDVISFIAAVEYASDFASKILVEHAVTSLREINCAALGDADSVQTSVCEEPVQCDEILSYEDKYMGGSKGSKGMSSLKRKCPAEISSEKEKEIRDLTEKTFKALGCGGVSRVDFLMDTADNDKVYVNEINTIPGSLSFYLWEAAGKPFETLCDELIDLAFKRDREKNALTFSFKENVFAIKGTKGLTGKK